MCFFQDRETKQSSFCHFPGKSDLFGKKFLYHSLPDMIIHAHAKFAPSDFINKKIMEKRRFLDPNRTPPLLKFPRLNDQALMKRMGQKS